MKRLVKMNLSADMEAFVDSVCQSIKLQRGSAQDYKQAANMIAKKFTPSSTNESERLKKTEEAILAYMREQGYVTSAVMNLGFKDENGIEVADIDAELPKELAVRKYGCRIYLTGNASEVAEAEELLLDHGFIKITAYKLKEQGVLSRDKVTFYAHQFSDCWEWARDVIEDLPGSTTSHTINIVWSQYYDIEETTEKTTKTIKYHKLK